ncbi:MAG TPA: hypothetical protein VGL10_06155, partial [Gammaproteobacteria bacterium]
SLSASSTQDFGILFRDINIPQGATITAANLLLTLSASSGGSLSTSIAVENADNAALFLDPSDVLGARTWGTAVSWNSMPSGSNNQTLTSPDLAAAIQAVVNRSSWVANNDMAFRIKRTANTGTRQFYSRDGTTNTNRRPRLQITYTITPSPITQTIGLRFSNISIPQGAKITTAYVDFKAATGSSDAVNYTIQGEKVADSTTFVESPNNITNRPKTTASTAWALSAATPWVANNNYQTPDLSAVLQEIVDQNDWCGSQALSLILTAYDSTATRRAYSYDGSSAGNPPPTLHVQYSTENLTSSQGCVLSTFTSQINHSYDDAEERSGGDLRISDQDLELGDYSSYDQYVGLRFREVNVPQGSEIVSAYLQFTAEDATSSSTSLTIKAHDADEPPTFNGDYSISSRVTTSASVAWNSVASWVDEGIYNSPDIKSVVQEIVNRSDWSDGQSMAFIITSTSSSYRRAHSFNDNAAKAPRLFITAKLKLGDLDDVGPQTVRQQLIEEVNSLETVGSTPTVNVYMEALRYFRGMSVYWGMGRYNQTDLDRYGRVSHEDSYTGGTHSYPSGCSALALNNEECVDESISGSATYISPMTDPCQANYIVVLSDGEQNSYSSGDNAASLVGTCSSADGGYECGVKLAKFARDVDQASTLTSNQTIRTDTIGFAENIAFLEDMAEAGGGNYYQANDSASLSSAFTSIVADILSKPTTFVAPTLTISAYNRLFNSDEIYISIFKPELSAAWQGNVKKFFLCNPGESGCTVGQLVDVNRSPAVADGHIKADAESAWGNEQDGPLVEKGGSGKQIQAQGFDTSSRRVYTYTGSSTDLTHSSNQVVDTNTAIDETMLDVPVADVPALINWIRGQDLDDEDGDNEFDESRWVFGDPLHSAAITINYGKPANDDDPDKVVTKLVVGTNDGGFRMINTYNGKEEWIFIPQDMLAIQKKLRADSGGNHVYGIDGSPVSWVNDKDGDSNIEKSDGDFVKLFVGERRGGSHYYALDATPASPISDPDVVGSILPTLMWQIDNTGDFATMGQTWSKPSRTRILVEQAGTTVKKNVLIFGGGYDETYDSDPVNNSTLTPADSGNAIYIVDAETGNLIWWASDTGADANHADMVYSIPSDIRMIDMDGDNATDRLYVGDMGGQVWRVDLKAIKSDGSGGVVGKLASLSSTATAADKRHFMYRPEVLLINDTEFAHGEYVAVILNSGDRENPLAKHVHDRVYVLRDYLINPMTSSTDLDTITHADLADVTDDIQTSTADLDAASNAGWWIDLAESNGDFIGEKGIT